ncbi:MAG: phosphate acyltransferase PlsX [Candidatus Muiribacteriota bacterium]|jgi:glycerol-3-phosphate acyltransferase PlsX
MTKTVIVDIMGGDNSPEEILNGVKLAEKEFPDLNFLLVGDKEKAEPYLWNSEKIKFENIKFDKAEEYKIKRNSSTSISKGIELLKNGQGNAFISAGNTGKVVAESYMKLGKIEGVERPAIGVVIPGINKPSLLLDVGANADCKPVYFSHFAILGSVYGKILFDIKSPRVGLLNIGSEDFKGSKLYQETYSELKNNTQINFVGNIEANSIVLEDNADVVVCDGFAGNIVLKAMEGVSQYVFHTLSKLNVGKEVMSSLMKSLDYQEYGGALLAGVKAPVVICHGASSGRAIKNAIQFADLMIKESMVDKIEVEIREFNKKNIQNTSEEE